MSVPPSTETSTTSTEAMPAAATCSIIAGVTGSYRRAITACDSASTRSSFITIIRRSPSV